MPYASDSDVPSYVPSGKRAQWREVWNSAYDRAIEDGKSKDDAESSAFAQANAVAGPNAKAVLAYYTRAEKQTKEAVNYTPTSPHPDEICGGCEHFIPTRDCRVVASGVDGIADVGWCKEYDPLPEGVGAKAQKAKEAVSMLRKKKFIPFSKVDAQKRQVWGIVTAERPDKVKEVCDYTETKKYYKKLMDEMSARSDGDNLMPLREMHQLSAVGKGIAYDFRDVDKEIHFGFEVVDDDAWKKVEKKVYTGFSQGGTIVDEPTPDPVFKGCLRYIANPSEVSLVDNPCLEDARYTYISKSGEVRIEKFMKTVPAVSLPLDELNELIQKAVVMELALAKGKTKRVAGEDLPASAFAYVGDKDDTSTWHLPIKFSNEAKTKRHIRNALARENQTSIPAAARSAVHARLVAAAKQHGIDVAEEKARLAMIQKYLRQRARIAVNRLTRVHGDGGHAIAFLDAHLNMLAKGLHEVSRLACLVQELGYMLYCICSEQEYEGDEESPLPEMLADDVNRILDTLLAMAHEEVDEMREDVGQLIAGERA